MGAPLTPFGFPSELYHCLLDEQPYYLTPSHLLDDRELLGPTLVNPTCWFSWHGDLPNHMASRVDSTDQFCPGDVAWVEDPATLAIWPFWVGEEYFGYLSRMVPGTELEENLPEHVHWVLTQANILVQPNYVARRRLDWHNQARSYAGQFERGYVPIPGLIPPFHVGALRRYYRHRTRNGYFLVGDEQVRRRFAAHNEPVARFVHHQLTSAFSDISGKVLKPSYAYFVSYLSGADLEEHVDRKQCDYSITACIDASPEPRSASPWPIKLSVDGESISVYQSLGDALIYRGCAIAHSRDRLPNGYTSASLLLHYVDESFDGPLD